MNNDLQQKLSKLIEANFSKMELEVLVRLLSEHEALTKDLSTAKEKFEQVKQERDNLSAEVKRKECELSDNYYRLMLAFPEYVMLWEEWQNTEKEEDFFKKYKL